MMASSRESPSVRGTNRKWYMAVSANWSRDSVTMSSSMTLPFPISRVEPQDAVGECGLAAIVGRDDDSRGTRFAHQVGHYSGGEGLVQPGRRLIQQPHGRRLEDDARQ